jgi:hypothetical protein
MLAHTIASYTKKNTNSKISVQDAMLVDTKRNDNIEEDSYNNKRKGQKRKSAAPPDQDNQGSK